MPIESQQSDSEVTAETIIRDFFSQGVSPVEIERVHNDMLLHYLRPTDDWNLSPQHALQALDYGEIVTQLLRAISKLARR